MLYFLLVIIRRNHTLINLITYADIPTWLHKIKVWRQKDLTGYWFKYTDKPFCLRGDDMLLEKLHMKRECMIKITLICQGVHCCTKVCNLLVLRTYRVVIQPDGSGWIKMNP